MKKYELTGARSSADHEILVFEVGGVIRILGESAVPVDYGYTGASNDPVNTLVSFSNKIDREIGDLRDEEERLSAMIEILNQRLKQAKQERARKEECHEALVSLYKHLQGESTPNHRVYEQ